MLNVTKQSSGSLCYGPSDYTLQTCHCGADRNEIYKQVNCEMIEQDPLHRIISVCILFWCIGIIVPLCIYWLYAFFGHRHMRAYQLSLRVRRPLFMILSYSALLPFTLISCT